MEVWKDIKGYEGLYQVSNQGRVRSLDRYVTHKNISKKLIKGKILKQRVAIYNYKVTALWKNNKRKHFRVHRLVAQAFITNPLNKKTVNHINGNKNDNMVENLEWNTQLENMQHAWKTGLKNNNKSKKKVMMLSLNDEPLLWFDSMSEASEMSNIGISGISDCCSGKIKTSGGYKWKYYKGVKE